MTGEEGRHEKNNNADLSVKERKLAWEQEKRARREALVEHYKNAPWYIRIPRLYLLKPFIALVIIAAIGYGAFRYLPGIAMNLISNNKNAPVDHAKIEALSPIDEEGAKRIDAVPPVDKNDTWTICVYLVGSDLEDKGENDLSAVARAQIEAIKARMETESGFGEMDRLEYFSEDLDSNDLDLPAYLYYPVKPSAGKRQEAGTGIATEPGFASGDIGEMTSDKWSDNITIVIQTGGATRWSNTMVNPNRTQRFVYHKGVFKEVYDTPIQRAIDPKTLTSFLNFCKKEYPADHNMLLLWNHGGAAFGYGYDSIFDGMMSMKEVREGLEGAYDPNAKDPAFDIIGFDACLMSSLEVTHALDGFASYYAVSEESEPGEGWDYGPWLKAMTDDSTMSPAKVARSIADTYMDFYMTQNVNMGWLFSNNLEFSVLDAKACKKLYKAWCDLSEKQLIDAAADNSVLAEIGRCSNKSTHLVPSAYTTYNTIDLGNYIDQMADAYPEETGRIRKLINEAVMYHRENGALSDVDGISVYVPGSVEDFTGLMMCLRYIYEICDDPATQALYYYKIAGCLNEDMQKYLATKTDKKVKTLDLKPFIQFKNSEPVITDYGFDIPVDQKLQDMLQSYDVELGFYDNKAGKLFNYGRDELARLDGEGNLDCEFDGTWICLDGVPLATEVVASTSAAVEYRSHILYNGKDAYLSFSWDRDNEVFNIDGVRGVSPYQYSGGMLNAEYSPDPINYLVNSRMVTELKSGDEIIPVYEMTPIGDDNGKNNTDTTRKVKIRSRSKISAEKLDDGYYLTTAVVDDYRGDVYYSQVVGNTVSGGKVSERKTDTNFIGRDH